MHKTVFYRLFHYLNHVPPIKSMTVEERRQHLIAQHERQSELGNVEGDE
jgi:hypothetical protein